MSFATFEFVAGRAFELFRCNRTISSRLRTSGCILGPHWLRPHILHAAIGWNDVSHILIVLFQLHKVGNVEEGITLQAYVDKSRLHAGKNPGYAAFVDGSG